MSDISSGPWNQSISITPSDTASIFPDATKPVYGIHVGGAGNITVVKRDGTTQLYTNPAVGFILPVICVQVKATGTTATALVGVYES